jgi:hypothetical protein
LSSSFRESLAIITQNVRIVMGGLFPRRIRIAERKSEAQRCLVGGAFSAQLWAGSIVELKQPLTEA